MVTIQLSEADADILANILAAVANGNYETENEALVEAADRLLDQVVRHQPDALIGYANLFSDGKTWSSVYPTAEGAMKVARGLPKGIETAVPLYRQPR